MSNPVIDVFFLGRAFAEVLTEKLESSLTDALSDLGKLDAETREKMREFTEEVKNRAEAAKQQNYGSNKSINIDIEPQVDLQEILDELRSEIARLKAELNNYRHRQQES